MVVGVGQQKNVYVNVRFQLFFYEQKNFPTIFLGSLHLHAPRIFLGSKVVLENCILIWKTFCVGQKKWFFFEDFPQNNFFVFRVGQKKWLFFRHFTDFPTTKKTIFFFRVGKKKWFFVFKDFLQNIFFFYTWSKKKVIIFYEMSGVLKEIGSKENVFKKNKK